jgi:hypothetical protein
MSDLDAARGILLATFLGGIAWALIIWMVL